MNPINLAACAARSALVAVAAAVLAGCASSEGRWWYSHPVHNAQQTNEDFNLCTTGWLSTPLAAEYTRQMHDGEKEDRAAGGYPWRKAAAKRRRDNAKSEHIRTCMTAIGYTRLWFDRHSPLGRPYRAVPTTKL